MDLSLLACAVRSFNISRLLVLMIKVRATSTRSTVGLTILSCYLNPWGWHLGVETSRICCQIWSVFVYVSYCILISAFCWLKYRMADELNCENRTNNRNPKSYAGLGRTALPTGHSFTLNTSLILFTSWGASTCEVKLLVSVSHMQGIRVTHNRWKINSLFLATRSLKQRPTFTYSINNS